VKDFGMGDALNVSRSTNGKVIG